MASKTRDGTTEIPEQPEALPNWQTKTKILT